MAMAWRMNFHAFQASRKKIMKLKKELKESWASLPNAPKSNGNLAKELSNLKVDIKKLEEKEAKVK